MTKRWVIAIALGALGTCTGAIAACGTDDESSPVRGEHDASSVAREAGTGGEGAAPGSDAGGNDAGGDGASDAPAEAACDEAWLAWDGPTMYGDGTCVQPQSVAGFNVVWVLDAGPDASGVDGGPFHADAGYPCVPGPPVACGDAGQTVPVPQCTYRVRGLVNGTWIFTTTAYDDAGTESPPSNPASKTIACP